MLKKKCAELTAALALTAALGLTLTACAGGGEGNDGGIQDASEGVAATLTVTDREGQEQTLQIGEKIVTEYVQDFRQNNELTDDDAWAQWMADNALTPSDVRTQVITYYKEELLLDEAAKMYDVSVDESEVQEALNQIKGQFESDEAYQEALSATGMTEEEYIEKVLEPNTLQTKLAEAVEAEEGSGVDVDAQTLSLVQSMESTLDGSRRSSHILFAADDEKTAKKVASQLKEGSLSWDEAVTEYSTDEYTKETGGDNGWNSVTTFVDAYNNALVELEKDEISDPVTSDYGIHIIKCTDVYTVPEGGITSLDQVPTEIVEAMKLQIENSSSDTFTAWFTEFSNNAQLTINDMPENLPYNVDMSAYQAVDGDQATEGEATGETAPTEGDTVEGSDASEQGAEGDAVEQGAEGDATAAEPTTEEGESTDKGAEGASDEGAQTADSTNQSAPEETIE